MYDMYGNDLRKVDSWGTPTPTEVVFTDERFEDLEIVWDGLSTFTAWAGVRNVDVFTVYGEEKGHRCALEQAQQAAQEWFDAQAAGEAQ